LIRPQAS